MNAKNNNWLEQYNNLIEHLSIPTFNKKQLDAIDRVIEDMRFIDEFGWQSWVKLMS